MVYNEIVLENSSRSCGKYQEISGREHMKKTESTGKNNGWGQFRINHIVIVWMIITFGTILLLFVASRQYGVADSQQSELTKKILRCHRYADQMQDTSDTLTNAVWRFAVTKDVAYVDNYLKEVEKVYTKDRAESFIKEEEPTAEEREYIQSAERLLKKLGDQELYYLRLIYESAGIAELPEAVEEVVLADEDVQLSAEEMSYKASKFVFGQEYLRAKEKIEDCISAFSTGLTMRLEQELEETANHIQRARYLLMITLAILLIWSITFWILFRRWIVHPMRACIQELREEEREAALTLRGPYELRCLIEAFNGAIAWLKDKNYEIYKIKMEDPVTGGFTSARFDLEAEGYLKEQHLFTFVSMDIKRFKLINELYGEAAGNKVLRKIYRVINKSLNPGEFVARSRADIFNIVLQADSQERIEQRVGELTNAIAEGFQGEKWDKYHLVVNCGVYQVQKGDSDITNIYGRANAARKKHKNNATLHSPCEFYSDGDWERLIKEQHIENQMERALEDEEFQVYLQPKVRLTDERVAGAEALVRWKSKDGRMIPPNEFIPLFEENGFIIKLDYYMFSHVCALIRKWIDRGEEPLPISVNLSREHVKDKDFIKQFQKIQQEYKIPSKYIEFEVTEAMVVENLDTLKNVLADCAAAGFRCSMDDFGSGYSSLNMLKEIPLDVLKLDGEFFNGHDNERGDNVIRAVLKMAKELNMQTVAEGVETPEWVEFLKSEGCDLVQGFVFYRPMPIEQFETEVFGR